MADKYVAFCLDEAVAMIGNHISGELESITGKNQKQIEGRRAKALRRLLGQISQFQEPMVTR